MKEISSIQLMEKPIKPLGIGGVYGRLVGDLQEGQSILIWGPQGAGKSTVALGLCCSFADYGPVKYIPAEERFEGTLVNRLRRLSAAHKQLNFILYDDFRSLKKYLKNKNAKFACIDSISALHYDPRELIDFIKWCKDQKITLVLVAQATKAGMFRGDNRIAHEVDLEIEVTPEGEAKVRKTRIENTEDIKIPFTKEEMQAPETDSPTRIRENQNYYPRDIDVGDRVYWRKRLRVGSEIKQEHSGKVERVMTNQNKALVIRDMPGHAAGYKMFVDLDLLMPEELGEKADKILQEFEEWASKTREHSPRQITLKVWLKNNYPKYEKFSKQLWNLKFAERKNPETGEAEFYGIEYIENPDDDFRENKAVEPDEIYQTITDHIINTIEEKGHLPWQKEWDDTGLYKGRFATNFISKKPYRGINFFLLNFEQKIINDKPVLVQKEFENPYFLTFNQINDLGGKLKKGSKGQMVVYFTRLYKYEQADPELEFGTYDRNKFIEWLEEHRDEISIFDQGFSAESIAAQSHIPILKYYRVFHGKDVEGIDFGELPKHENAELDKEQRIEIAEAIFEHFPKKPELKFLGQEAYYNLASDFINMPKFESFSEPQFYYTTLFHESVHSTAHHTRLDRDITGRSGTQKYAFEELIGEMGAVYLCAESGILFRTIDNSAKYLSSWNKRLVKEMEKDNRFFFRAASRAQEAADYILDRDKEGTPAYMQKMSRILDFAKSQEVQPEEQASENYLQGESTTVDFKADGSVSEQGFFGIVEASDIIASHHKDCSVNSAHSISRAQPRDRSIDALCAQPKFIAKNLNPTSITEGNLAFNGAPVLTLMLQTIQGNGRSIALKIAYDEIPESAEKYRSYLLDNAGRWGFSADQINEFDQPVLVRFLDVSDNRAIELGNIVDTSQAKLNKIDAAKAYVRNLPKQKRQIIGDIINDSGGETIGEVIDDVGIKILDQFKDLDRSELIEEGALTGEGKDFLRSVFAGLVFDSEERKGALQSFLNLPHRIKAGIERSYGHLIPFVGTPADLTPALQGAVIIVDELSKRSEIDTVDQLFQSIDAFEGSFEDRFSDKEKKLAEFLAEQTGTQKEIRNGFRMYQYKINGREDLFNPIEQTDPDTAFKDAFIEKARINPMDEIKFPDEISWFIENARRSRNGNGFQFQNRVTKYLFKSLNEFFLKGKEFVEGNIGPYKDNYPKAPEPTGYNETNGEKELLFEDHGFILAFTTGKFGKEYQQVRFLFVPKDKDMRLNPHKNLNEQIHAAKVRATRLQNLGNDNSRELQRLTQLTEKAGKSWKWNDRNTKIEIIDSPRENIKNNNGSEVRINPKEHLVFIGIAKEISVETAGQERAVTGEFPMLTSEAKDRLYLIPQNYLKPINGKAPDSQAAKKVFKEWHRFESDGKKFAVRFPEQRKATPVGTARNIVYSSDKKIEPGDKKGHPKLYKHTFDPGKRPVSLIDGILVISNIEIDERGILN